MGEYNKTYAQIMGLKQRKTAKEKQIKKLEKWIARLNDDIYEIELEIADCEAYLSELDYIDNGGNR